MLTSTVELLAGLCLEAVILLIGFCILGSIVAALRAVSEGHAASTRRGSFIDNLGNRPEAFADAKPKVLSAASALKLQPFPRK